jgi:hypothetical protein
MRTVSSAERACNEPASSSGATATVAMPSSRQARNTRSAISPRLATKSFSIGIARRLVAIRISRCGVHVVQRTEGAAADGGPSANNASEGGNGCPFGDGS